MHPCKAEVYPSITFLDRILMKLRKDQNASFFHHLYRGVEWSRFSILFLSKILDRIKRKIKPNQWRSEVAINGEDQDVRIFHQ